MLTTAILLTVGLAQTQPAPSQFQSLTGQPVENLFPTISIPVSTVNVGGHTFAIQNETTLGAYIPNPAAASVWEGIQGSAPATEPKSASFRVRIALFSEILMLDETDRGWMQKRSNLSFFDREELTRAIAQFDLQLRRSGLDPMIDFSEDDDVIVLTSSKGNSANIFDEISGALSPRTNDDLFESDDPTYRGPFDMILALHAGMTNRVESGMLGHTPITVVPILNITQHKLDVDLSSHLLSLVTSQLQQRRFPLPTTRLSWVPNFTTIPVLPSIDPTVDAPVPADGRAKPDPVKFLDAADPICALPRDTTVAIWPTEGSTRVAATGIGWTIANHLKMPFTSSSVVADNSGRIWMVGTVAGRKSMRDLVNGEFKTTPTSEQPAPPVGNLPLQPAPFGSYVWELNDKNERTGNIIQTADRTNGGIRLISRVNTPVISNPAQTILTLKLKLKSIDPYALNFYGQNHRYLGSVQISGNHTAETNVTAARQVLTGEPQSFTFSLAKFQEPIYAIEFGSTPAMVLNTRQLNDPATFAIESLAFTDEAALTLDSSTPFEQFDRTSSKEELLKTQSFANPEIAIAAAGILTENPKTEDLLMYGEMSRSGREAVAWFGARALGKLGTPEALGELRKTLVQGPFDTNRRFAAQQINQPLPDAWLTDINGALASRSWQTRYYVSKLFKLNPSSRSQIFLVSSIQDPVSNVRAEIAADLDANVALSARRLLYLAVNDTSERVRAVSYSRLLEAKDAAVVDEAVRGIRDESRLVKLTILGKIESMPDEKFRGALRNGVLDRNPEIQVAVLSAFQRMPEAVTFEEISNVVGSNSEAVQLAMLKLADAKKIALPKPELDRLSQSAKPEIAALAKKLGGGS